MGSVYARGQVLWLKLRAPDGTIVRTSSGLKVGQEVHARRQLERIEARIAAGEDLSLGQPLTLERYAKRWCIERKAQGIRTAEDDASRLALHVLPTLGRVELARIRPAQLVNLFSALRNDRERDLAPKTIHNIYGSLSSLFRDAVIADLVEASPCILRTSHLGPNRDRDPDWRGAAILPRAELERLLGSPDLPEDRRLLWALLGVAGLRLGEACGLRWQDVEFGIEPLGRLRVVKSWDEPVTKSGVARAVPIHPTLGALLAAWRLRWPAIFGHAIQPADLVVPNIREPGKGRRLRTGDMRTESSAGKGWGKDRERLALSKVTAHDLRATFITLCEEDGADPDTLRRITHTEGRGSRGAGAFEGYLRRQWPRMCREIEKLKLQLSGLARVIPLGTAWAQ